MGLNERNHTHNNDSSGVKCGENVLKIDHYHLKMTMTTLSKLYLYNKYSLTM